VNDDLTLCPNWEGYRDDHLYCHRGTSQSHLHHLHNQSEQAPETGTISQSLTEWEFFPGLPFVISLASSQRFFVLSQPWLYAPTSCDFVFCLE
jgi:hypothetical protein